MSGTKRSESAKRRDDVHDMMASVYASKSNHPKGSLNRSLASWNLNDKPYGYGMALSFGEALAEVEAQTAAQSAA